MHETNKVTGNIYKYFPFFCVCRPAFSLFVPTNWIDSDYRSHTHTHTRAKRKKSYITLIIIIMMMWCYTFFSIVCLQYECKVSPKLSEVSCYHHRQPHFIHFSSLFLPFMWDTGNISAFCRFHVVMRTKWEVEHSERKSRTKKGRTNRNEQQAEPKMNKTRSKFKALEVNYISKLIQPTPWTTLYKVLIHTHARIYITFQCQIDVVQCKCILCYKYECYCLWYMAFSLVWLEMWMYLCVCMFGHHFTVSFLLLPTKVKKKCWCIPYLRKTILCIKLLGTLNT